MFSKLKQFYGGLIAALQKRPMVSFFVTLALLLLAIFASKILLTPKPVVETKSALIKSVKIYQVGAVPKLSFQGQVKKVGVVKIQSQTPGVIQSVNVSEGDEVQNGQNLINISTTYSGANAANVAAGIAARQYKMVNDTFDTQKDLLSKQRDLANAMHDNSSNLATISAQSKGETESLINLNQDILNSLNQSLTTLKNNNAPQSDLLPVEQAISGFQAGQNQLQSALRNISYSTNTSNAPQQLNDLQRDITVKNLEVQEKSLEMNRDISRLQTTLANISASFFHPTAPFAGKVERIFVHPLDVINPGQPLLTLVGNNKTVQLVVQIPQEAAQNLSQIEPATIHLGSSQEELMPSFVSNVATDGRLYSVVFNLPESDYSLVSDGDFIAVDLPLGVGAASGHYFVPIDSVIQTQDLSLVYVASANNKVEAKKVELGTVSGKFAEVVSGLNGGEKLILNRNVVDGDKVKLQ